MRRFGPIKIFIPDISQRALLGLLFRVLHDFQLKNNKLPPATSLLKYPERPGIYGLVMASTFIIICLLIAAVWIAEIGGENVLGLSADTSITRLVPSS